MRRKNLKLFNIGFSLLEVVIALALLGLFFVIVFQLWYPLMTRFYSIHKSYDILYCMDLTSDYLLKNSFQNLESKVNLYLKIHSETKEFFWSCEDFNRDISNLKQSLRYNIYRVELDILPELSKDMEYQYMSIHIYQQDMAYVSWNGIAKDRLLVTYPFYKYVL